MNEAYQMCIKNISRSIKDDGTDVWDASYILSLAFAVDKEHVFADIVLEGNK